MREKLGQEIVQVTPIAGACWVYTLQGDLNLNTLKREHQTRLS
jgi:hypothetical protein